MGTARNKVSGAAPSETHSVKREAELGPDTEFIFHGPRRRTRVQPKFCSLRFESVDIQFTRDARGTEDADVVTACADIDFTVGNGWDRELDGEARRIGSHGGTVPQLSGQIGRIVSIEHRRAASWRERRAVLACVQRPDDAVLRRCSPHPRGAGGKYEWMGGGGTQVKLGNRGSQLIGSERSAEASEIEFVVPERAGGKDLGTEADFLHRIAVTISAERIPIHDIESLVLAATQQQVGDR